MTPQERFQRFIDYTDYCWVWTGATDKFGYGHFYLDKDHQSAPAHTVAFEWAYGPLPKGYEPDHVIC